jgi:PPP family 3-phenylpropionic acid transporter
MQNSPGGWLRIGRLTRRPMLAYALISGGPAAITPFAAVWLHGHGIALPVLGICLAAPLMVRPLIAGPLTGWVARFDSPWAPMAILCGLAALVAMLGLQPVPLPASLAIWTLAALAAGACIPILDATILSSTGGESNASLLPRAKSAGALAFLSASLGIGFCSARIGLMAIMLWAAASGAMAALYCACSALRRDNGARAQPDRPSVIAVQAIPAGRGSLALALLAAALIEASHGLHAVAMIGWKARGLGPEINSALWATGTLCDVMFLGLAGPLCHRLGSSRLLMVGAAAAMARWAGFAMAPALPWLFVLQGLHALSFTATCLASVQIAQALAHRRSKLGYQILTWATSTGLAGGVAVITSGPLYARFGVQGYWLMSALAALGLVMALLFHRGFASSTQPRCSPGLQHGGRENGKRWLSPLSI